MKIHIRFRLIISLLVFCPAIFAQSQSKTISFNSDWKFIKSDADSYLVTDWNNKNIAWQKVNLPHSANIEQVDSTNKQWQGLAWYQKSFTLPKDAKGKLVYVTFEAAMQVAKVYLNNELLTIHEGGYLPFQVRIDEKYQWGKENTLSVELDNRDNPAIPPGKPLATLDFNYYSGIYRNVYLEIKDKLHIADAVTANRIAGGGILVSYDNVTSTSALVKIQAEVDNFDVNEQNASLAISLMAPDGKNIAGKKTNVLAVSPGEFVRFNEEIRVENPELWSPASPKLYQLRISVLKEGQPVEIVEKQIGIRTFSFSARDGFVINGEKLKIRGTNRHQEYPYIGNALPDNAQYRDAYKIKQAGFNFVRTSHYPQSPAFLDACDQLGILVMDAIPGWQFAGDSIFQENSIRDVHQMVRRDRNHPGIILWEASLNESWMTKDYIQRAHDAVHHELPVKDVYTCGWMDSVYDVFIPARQHAKPPFYWNHYSKNKPLLIAEYGDWEYYAQNAGFNQTAYGDLKEDERNSRQLRAFGQKRLNQQALNYQEAHNDNLRGVAVGDANWLMFDYKRGYAPDIESSGIMDIFRLPKFAFYFYQSQADTANGIFGKPMVFIASYWNNPENKTVKIFSNCQEVELWLNDQLISRQKPDTDTFSTNLPHPPFTFTVNEYKPGKLVAKGFINGQQMADYIQKTAEKPTSIKLTVDENGKPLATNDVAFVYASVADLQGTIVSDDHRLITYSVEGGAELIGENPRQAEAGIATILVRTGIKAGKIKITAKAEGLKTAVWEIEIK